jgi:hypothetical protein
MCRRRRPDFFVGPLPLHREARRCSQGLGRRGSLSGRSPPPPRASSCQRPSGRAWAEPHQRRWDRGSCPRAAAWRWHGGPWRAPEQHPRRVRRPLPHPCPLAARRTYSMTTCARSKERRGKLGTPSRPASRAPLRRLPPSPPCWPSPPSLQHCRGARPLCRPCRRSLALGAPGRRGEPEGREHPAPHRSCGDVPPPAWPPPRRGEPSVRSDGSQATLSPTPAAPGPWRWP